MKKQNKLYLLSSGAALPLLLAICAICATKKTNNAVTTVSSPPLQSLNSFYPSNKAPLQPLHFIKLPIGSIKPGGWIKKYLELQRDGLTGHLGEISAWLEKKNNAWFSGTGQGDHGWEEVPYWLKGYGDLGYLLNDPAIIKETKLWLDKVFESQQKDGYFGPAVVEMGKELEKGNTPDLWPNMIMLWCLQSYYDYSHDPRVLPFMTRYFRWELTVPDNRFLKRYWENSRGGDNLYSVYWLYNRTGEKWLLDLAAKIHRNTANWEQKDTLPNMHNVNIAQCFREPATYFMQSDDSASLRATYNDFHLIRNLYGQVPGGMFGADENARPGYTDPRQAVETCGMVEQMASDELLTGITGDPFWADQCEDVAFNTYPAAVMPDFKGLRYLTAPNMVLSDSSDHSPGIENGGPYLMMNPFSSRCCQHNHTQGWPYYAEHLWMATPDNGLAAMLYNACGVTARVGGGNTVTLKEDTHYPFDDQVIITVETSKTASFPLYLRIPAWCTGAAVFINDELQQNENKPGTYTRIERKWKNKDVVKLILPMKIALKQWKQNKNSVSVNYGPLTFSLKIEEHYKQADSRKSAIGEAKWQANVDESLWPSFEIFPAGPWNYGLPQNEIQDASMFEIVKKAWPADDFPFSQKNVPIEIKTKGNRIPSWKIDRYGLCDTLPANPVVSDDQSTDIVLIPMGAARLRIAAFPVVKAENMK
ncbi:MAG: glycoside hydrolase family 127 protein [Bacteroidota bacterium]|nr:glycoside hydrolase family 127 protein [Bacteroidota bacterium]